MFFRYHLEHLDSLFNIDTNSGWIKVFKQLDAEQEVTHELKVKAEDGNGLSALTTVRIHVQDVNDNPHHFTQLHYNAAVNEGALPGNFLEKIFRQYFMLQFLGIILSHENLCYFNLLKYLFSFVKL